MHKLKVSIHNSQKSEYIDGTIRTIVKECCAQVLTDEKFPDDAQVDVTFVDDEKIREMNRLYRRMDKSTDVLSFPMGENGDYDRNPENGCLILGDIVISVDTAYRQAEEYGHCLEREIGFLTVHSMLHLLGYDHMEEDDAKIMREKEERSLIAVGLRRETSND
ncbi:MAG: rRNA maturation RNase YbeY [Oscillospiraceae bacterium]|nr:rRNA maturation RNase YbeY [Oscillospiraceae bacterium]MBR4347226.1 rRNA maturation RNase YbeY [Oscillospiraceae bacterium]